MALLQEVANAKQRERAENHDRDQQDFPHLRVMVEIPMPISKAVTTAQIVRMM